MSIAGVVLLMVFGLAGTPVYSQQGNGECLEHVRKLYRELGDPPPGNRVYATSYTVHVRVKRSGKVQNLSSNVRVLMSRDRMHLMTDAMEVYQDNRQVFTLLSGSRALHIHDGDAEGGRDLRKKMIGAFQDSLFSACTVESCRTVRGENGREKRRVVLRMHERIRKAYAIATVTIDTDVARGSIDVVEYNFVPGGEQEWMKVVVHDFDRDFKSPEFSRPLASMFLDAGGDVLPKYRRYSVVDRRRRGSR